MFRSRLAAPVAILALGGVLALAGGLPPTELLVFQRRAAIAELYGRDDERAAILREAAGRFPSEPAILIAMIELQQDTGGEPAEVERLRAKLRGMLLDEDAEPQPALLAWYLGSFELELEEAEIVRDALAAWDAARPGQSAILQLRAAVEKALGHDEELAQIAGRLAAKAESDVEVFSALATSYDAKRWKDALDLAEKLLATHPSPDVRLIRIEALSALGRAEEAHEFLLALFEDSEGFMQSSTLRLQVLGWDFHDRGQDALSESTFRKLLEYEPERHELLATITHLFASGEEKARAAAELERRWAEEDDPEALLQQGTALLGAGDADAAWPLLERASKGLPRNLIAWYNLGIAAIQTARWNQAMEAFTHALTLKPDNVDVLFNRGVARFNAKRWAGAAEDLERVLELVPRRTDAYYYLSHCYSRLGRSEESKRAMDAYKAGAQGGP